MLSIAQFDGQSERNQSATQTTASNRNEKGISDNIGVHQNYSIPSGGISSSTEFASKILKGTEDWEAIAVDKYSIEKQSMSKTSGLVRKDNSISILEEFFGNALSKTGGNLPTYNEVLQHILAFLCSLFTFLHVPMPHVDLCYVCVSIRYSHNIILRTILCAYDMRHGPILSLEHKFSTD
jgi:hypothetical protein